MIPRPMTSFPERFAHLTDQVAELYLIHALSRDDVDVETLAQLEELGVAEDYRACELWITLKRGESFGFLTALPEYLRDYMKNEKELAFIASGLLVVSEMTLEAILYAIEECLSQAKYYGLEHFGYRMSTDEEDSTE